MTNKQDRKNITSNGDRMIGEKGERDDVNTGMENDKRISEETPEIDLPIREINDLRAELKTVKDEAAAAKEEMLRKAADLDNARKRLERERQQIQERAAERIIRALLPALNDLARAIEMADTDEAVPQHHVDAIIMMEKKVFDILKSEGMEPINAKPGDDFDPEIHEAVLVACDPAYKPGQVISVMDGGYIFKGKLLIPARVMVCIEDKNAAPGTEETVEG